MTNKLAVSFGLLTLLSGLSVQPGAAQGVPPVAEGVKPDTVANTLGTEDVLFIQRAAKDGFQEVHIGELALKHGESQAVKTLAQKMIDDHKRANQELIDLAKRKGVKLPADETSSLINLPMAKASGADFDALFRKGVIADHEDELVLFERQASSGADADMKEWAAKSVVILKQHLAEAKALPE